MGYTKKIRFEYYEVVCRRKEDRARGADRSFDLTLWIDKARKLSLEARTFDYFQEQARLDQFWFDEDKKLWFFSFLRLRETNIPSIAKNNQEAEPMELNDDEYIAEKACAIYDKSDRILMLQRNRYSLGHSGIELYLNMLWENEDITIYLRPIAPLNIQSAAQHAAEYRKFTIRFADVNKNTIGNQERNTPLRRLYDGLKQYNALNAEVTITMGYDKTQSLDSRTIKDSIDEIIENKGIVAKAELGIKKDDDSRVEIIDLFEEKLHDFIFVNLEKRKSIANEFMADNMMVKYLESKGKIIAALRAREQM